jgi:hypothetical protein
MIKVAWKMAGTFAVTSFVVFDTLRSHTLLFLCLWEKIARVRLHLVALFGEMLLVVGRYELFEELGSVELEVLRAKEEVQERRLGNRLWAHIIRIFL